MLYFVFVLFVYALLILEEIKVSIYLSIVSLRHLAILPRGVESYQGIPTTNYVYMLLRNILKIYVKRNIYFNRMCSCIPRTNGSRYFI